jgi:hypothetical protein
MRTIVPAGLLKPTNILLAILLGITGFSQTIPELVFRNPVLISGTANQDGAKYRFSNVTTGPGALDVIVEVKGRSANDVVLKSIDSSGVGWDKAFQPTLGIPNVGANREWWVEFEMQFVNSGTTNSKVIDTFYVTGLDIDGDGNHLNEWAQMNRIKQVQLAPATALASSLLSTVADLLNLDNDGCDYRINGPTTNYNAIDTSSAAVMATYKYVKKDKITFRIGGKTNAGGGSSAAGGMRMNSLWFKQFSLTTNSTLPLNLIDFNAVLNKSKVDLEWTTAGEKNVSHFEMERSTDGINYSEAAVIFAFGNTNENKTYAFSDDISAIKSSIVYYRLRSVDIDGKSHLSPVRIIRISKQSEIRKLVTYPNPASDEVRLTVPADWQNKEVLVEIFNLGGQKLKTLKNNNASQTEIITISNLAKGLYFIKATCGAETAQQRFIKD